jgi:HEAT repeat protein
VAIRASSAPQVDALIVDLTGTHAVRRDAAVARLTVIGARAVERLVAVASSKADPTSRVAAFRALEGIGDERALDPALAAVGDGDPGVASAAVMVARVFIRSGRSAAVVDTLTAAALDTSRPAPVRVAAVRALRDLEARTVAPLLHSLASDADAAVRIEAGPVRRRTRKTSQSVAGDLTAVLDGPLPEDPGAVRDLLAAAGAEAPLPQLLQVVERVRERETEEPPARRGEWTTVRAAAHAILARRGSRIALYDLRESLETSAAPLPIDALTSLTLIGDASCLEPIASSFARSQDAWWRDHLAEAFRTIATRERLTARHAVMKAIDRKWKDAARLLRLEKAKPIRRR